MRTLIVDDEPIARARVKRLLAQFGEYQLVAEAENGLQALALTEQHNPDLVLLDINMPGLSGLEVAEKLKSRAVPPAIIFLTAHPEHALSAFSVAAEGYLVKPVTEQAMTSALAKLGQFNRVHVQKQQQTYISYQVGNISKRKAVSELLYCQAEDKYSRLVFMSAEAYTEQSLKSLLNQYSTELVQIHRKFIVNKHHIESVQTRVLGGHELKLQHSEQLLPISRREYKTIKSLLS